MRLLLVEDDEEISAMLKDFLEGEGFSVDTAADGEAGCARSAAAQYDLVLLDLMLPRRSGLDVLRAGALAMDCAAHRVEKDGIPVELTAKEYAILELLLRNPRRVYTKAQLYAAVWGEAYLGDENAVNVHISRLRSKVEDDPKKPRCICTVWGIGYKLGDGDGR